MTRKQQMIDSAKSAESNSRTIDLSKKQVFMSAYVQGWKDADSHPHWIPVEKELPKERGWYLVATPTLNSKIDVAFWDGKWFRLITITHWMPMPVPPRNEE